MEGTYRNHIYLISLFNFDVVYEHDSQFYKFSSSFQEKGLAP